jgi:hypothetical protein
MTDPNWTLRFPRTTRCDGHAIYHYRTPLYRRFFYALVRHGWLAILAALAVLTLTGCVDMESEQHAADSLRDAVAQARSER